MRYRVISGADQGIKAVLGSGNQAEWQLELIQNTYEMRPVEAIVIRSYRCLGAAGGRGSEPNEGVAKWFSQPPAWLWRQKNGILSVELGHQLGVSRQQSGP